MVVGDFVCECGSTKPPEIGDLGARCPDCGRRVPGTDLSRAALRPPVFRPATEKPKRVLSEEHKAAIKAGRERALSERKNKKSSAKDALETEMAEYVRLGREILTAQEEQDRRVERFKVLKVKFETFTLSVCTEKGTL